MDDKLNAALKGIYDSLTDEQKEKSKQCKTMDELTALAAKEGIELPDEVLDTVAGGAPMFDCHEVYGESACSDYMPTVSEIVDAAFDTSSC